MSKADDVFVKEFLLILGLLVSFTIAMVFLSRTIHANTMARIHSGQAATLERIAPVGKVETRKK